MTKETVPTPDFSKRNFSTGAKRSDDAGRPLPALISPYFLEELGSLLAEGKELYGARNWEKGIPTSSWMQSAFRHFISLMKGETDENHAVRVAFNMMGLIHTREMIRQGSLPEELEDY